MKLKPTVYCDELFFFNGDTEWNVDIPNWINSRFANQHDDSLGFGIHGDLKNYEVIAVDIDLFEVTEE